MLNDLIPDLLIIIFNYVPFETIISCRRINKRFENAFAFDIALIERQVYFRYNYKSIESIIFEQITPTFNELIGWYIQTLNVNMKVPIWYFTDPSQHPITSKNIINGGFEGSSAIGCIRHPANYDDRNSFSQTVAKPLYMNEKMSPLIWIDDDGTMMYYSIDDFNFVTSIFKHLSDDINMVNDNLDDLGLRICHEMFHILLMGYLYDIKPIKMILIQLMENNDQFFDAVHRSNIECFENDTVFAIGTKEMYSARQPLWQNCFELHSCHITEIVEKKPYADGCGRFAWIGEMCVRGDFSIYEKFMKKLKENEGYDFGYAYRGVASLMVMYKRCDLLAEYARDQTQCVESPLAMLSFAILPIKTG